MEICNLSAQAKQTSTLKFVSIIREGNIVLLQVPVTCTVYLRGESVKYYNALQL